MFKPNCAIKNASNVHTNVTTITFTPGLLLGSKFLSIDEQILLLIPAIIFTAVDTEPKTISIEIIGLKISGANPLFTRIIRGIDSLAKSGSFIIAVSPRTASKHIKPFTKNPYTIDVLAK